MDMLLNKTPKNNLEIENNPLKLTCMKYAPLNYYIDLERSFSRNKAMLRTNRCNFKFENFKL